MNYDLIIIKLTKTRLKQVIAHHIAVDPSISLQKALSLLDNLPLVYAKDLSFKELEDATHKLQKLGAVCRAVESKSPLVEGHKAEEKVPEKKIKTAKVQKREVVSPGTRQYTSTEKVLERVSFAGMAPQKKPVKRKKSVIANVIILAGIVIVIIIVFTIGKGGKVKIKPTGPVLTGKSEIKPGNVKGRPSKVPINNEKETLKRDRSKKEEVSASPAKRNSDAYTDSAVHICEDYECEIKFFRIALSFNQYNMRAWQGLIAAYRGAGRRAEAEKAERQMKELFGEKVFNVEEIVKPYGSLSRYDRDEKGVCRIEYRSQSSKRSDLEKETFYLIRALLAQQNCTMVSLYASTGKGEGMLVRIKADRFPSRISDYVKNASISFIE